jgi:hypothetical protein
MKQFVERFGSWAVISPRVSATAVCDTKRGDYCRRADKKRRGDATPHPSLSPPKRSSSF